MNLTLSQHRNEIANYAVTKHSGTDYMWFLVNICDYFKNEYRLEVMNDETGDCKDYDLKEFTLRTGEKDSMEFDLIEKKTRQPVKLILTNIKSISENEMSQPGQFFKYYLYSETGDYRFVLRCK